MQLDDSITRATIDDDEYLPFGQLIDHYVLPRYPNMDLEEFCQAERVLETMTIEERRANIHTIGFGDLGMLLISFEAFVKIFEALPKLQDRAFVEASFARSEEELDDESWEWCLWVTSPVKIDLEDDEESSAHQSAPMHGYTNAMWHVALGYFGGRCAYCGSLPGLDNASTFVREHYIPVSNPACPGATFDNILPACKTCNSQKNAHDPVEWLTKRYGDKRAAEIVQNIERYFDSVRETETVECES